MIAGNHSRAPKYGNKRALGAWGEIYDSKAERDYAADLELRRRAGAVSRWSWSPRFLLQAAPPITIRFDFVFWWRQSGALGEAMAVVDVKGAANTRDFSVKARLWAAQHPDIPLVIVRNGEEYWP